MNWLRYILTLIKFDAAEREVMNLRERNAMQRRIIENSHHNNDRLRAEVTELHRTVRALRITAASERHRRISALAQRLVDDQARRNHEVLP